MRDRIFFFAQKGHRKWRWGLLAFSRSRVLAPSPPLAESELSVEWSECSVCRERWKPAPLTAAFSASRYEK